MRKMTDSECRDLYELIKQNGRTRAGNPPFITEWTYNKMFGAGSFGCVCKITKKNSMGEQESALKIIEMDPVDIDKYKSELKTLEIVKNHPHAVKIEDFSDVYVQSGTIYDSYLLIRMEPLRSLPEDGMSVQEVINMGIDIAEILAFCHSQEKKILHRDIKPDNILISSHGEYKLSDFGISKILDKSHGSSRVGTPLFMAQEVNNGQRYDERSDLFSLGMTMYTMLNGGKTPFEDKNRFPDKEARLAEAWRRRMSGEKFPPIPGVSTDLQNIIWKLCQPDPAKRYGSASQLIYDLKALQGGVEPWLPKRAKITICAMAAALVLVVIVAGILIPRDRCGDSGGSGGETGHVSVVTDIATETEEPTTKPAVSNPFPPINDVSVGDHIEFGSYPQTKDGKEKPIKWRVLYIKDNNVLLMSEYLLDCKKYNNTYEYLTWEKCTLRKWLNSDFLNAAFSEGEQSFIKLRTNKNPDNPEHGTKGGETTKDKVFILSRNEVNNYLGSHEVQTAKPTDYAIKNGAHYDSSSDSGQWWIRSPGAYGSYAAYIGTLGRVNYYGRSVNEDNKCVRPVILVTFPE